MPIASMPSPLATASAVPTPQNGATILAAIRTHLTFDTNLNIIISVSKLESGLYRLEATEALENGSYCLSPSGSQDVFCFDVY